MDKHAERLGRLVSNMQSLEFVLRAFLLNSEIAAGRSSSGFTNLLEMNDGDEVTLNALTNYDTLSQLIKKYNRHPKISSGGLKIDESLVEIRNAIAHGRVSAPAPSVDLKLLKFDRPQNNRVKVAFSIIMTKDWFSEQIKRFHTAVLKVSEANEKLNSGEL